MTIRAMRSMGKGLVGYILHRWGSERRNAHEIFIDISREEI